MGFRKHPCQRRILRNDITDKDSQKYVSDLKLYQLCLMGIKLQLLNLISLEIENCGNNCCQEFADGDVRLR